jgi:hypothetical protein
MNYKPIIEGGTNFEKQENSAIRFRRIASLLLLAFTLLRVDKGELQQMFAAQGVDFHEQTLPAKYSKLVHVPSASLAF